MSTMIKAAVRQRLVNFTAFAYRALVLYFFLIFLLGFLFGHGGWINWLIVCLILACPLAVMPAVHLVRHGRKEKA